MEKSKGDNYEKKKDSEIHLLASLPKPQSLPAHQLFKDKRKVYQVQSAVVLLSEYSITCNQRPPKESNKNGLLSRWSVNAGSIKLI